MNKTSKEKTYFEKLNSIDVKKYIEEKKSGKTMLKYLSWANAWAELLKVYPKATYEILKFENNLPYVFDANTGYMVFTKITIEDLTKEMFLPVMNSSNKAMKSERYKYETKWNGTKIVEKATMFDINKTIMRCLVKNIAMFGLGLYIYTGEDLPEEEPKKPETRDEQMNAMKGVVKDLNDEATKQIEARKKAINSYKLLLEIKDPKNKDDLLKTFKRAEVIEQRKLYKELKES
jgi:hypothetical protein